MEKLLDILGDINLNTAIEVEHNDQMFIALEWLYNNLENKDFFIPLIIANALICYQLSSTWEEYWQEFSNRASKYNYQKIDDIFLFLIDFLPTSTGNKRLVPTKIERLKKLKIFLDDFFYSQKSYYKDMEKLQRDLAKEMKQNKTAKTIVFAVKIFWYWARIRFWEIKIYPMSINIPLDSRLQNLYEKYRWSYSSATEFYHDISKQLDIPPLHLDAVLWCNYESLMSENI